MIRIAHEMKRVLAFSLSRTLRASLGVHLAGKLVGHSHIYSQGVMERGLRN